MDKLMERLLNPPQPKVTIGAWYTLMATVYYAEKKVARRYRAVKKYRHFIMFEDGNGLRECFSRWELARCML